MKQLVVLGVVLLSWVSPAVMAEYTRASRVNSPELDTLISGTTVCASFGGDEWQEEHRAGGPLWDYKKGPSDPVDPSEQVGTWDIGGNQVRYTYGRTSYRYSVHDEGGGSYTFCGIGGGAPVISGATLVATASCP